ncbi:MAG: oligosaccharide flippase family protein [Bacteroidales bacterium]|nr:oligosaccharide flippase family protein [Bacteroidales bacterium]
MFFRDFSYYFIGNVISKAVAFILVPIYVSSMSTSEFGIVGSMQVLINVLAIFLSLGAEKSIFRLYHDYKTEDEKKVFLSTVSWFIYIFSFLMVCVMVLLHSWIEKIYTSIPFSPYYLYAIGTAFFMEFEVAPRIFLQVTTQSKKYLFLSLLQMMFSATAILYFTVYKHLEAVGMLRGMFVAQACMLPFYISIHLKNFNVRPSLKLIVPILKYCLPFLPSVIASWVITMSSQIFIERNFSTSEVAIYALTLKIVGVITIFASALMTAYKPAFYKLANSTEQDSAKQQLYILQNNIVNLLIVSSGLIAFFSKDLISLFFSSEYNEAVFLTPLVIVGITLSKISGYTNLAFYQEKKTVEIMWIMIVASVVSIGMNYVVIPRYSVYGAAFSYLVATSIFFVLKYVVSKSYYCIPFEWFKMFQMVIIMAFLCSLNIFVLPVGVVPLLIKLFCCGLILLLIRGKLLPKNILEV